MKKEVFKITYILIEMFVSDMTIKLASPAEVIISKY